MKLAVGYNCFNGVELLEHSIKQIRNKVDYIIVSYQEKDWYGINKISIQDIQLLNDLKNRKIIDSLNCFVISSYVKKPIQAKLLEIQKRNNMKNYCENKGFDFYLDMDVDEFYKEEEFENIKKYIEENNIDYSYCRFIDYYNEPIFRNKKLSKSYVPFICKLKKNKKLGLNTMSNIVMDPTRGYIINKEDVTYIIPEDKLIMHHMSNVRKNLKEKYLSSSMAILERLKINDLVKNVNMINKNNLEFNNRFFKTKLPETYYFEEVENIFGIPRFE